MAGLRRVIDEETVKKVLAVLADDVSEMPKNWNRRFKHNRDKIKTGDIYELAEVVRNLAIREHEKGLSTGEKQMYTRAKKILASELMYALDKDEDEAEAHLDDLLRASRPVVKARTSASRGDGGRAARGRRQWRTPWAAGPKAFVAWPAARCWSGASRPCRRAPASSGSSSRCRPASSRRPGRGVPGGAQRSQSVRKALRRAPATPTWSSSTTPPGRSLTPRARAGLPRRAGGRGLPTPRSPRRRSTDTIKEAGRRRSSCARWTARGCGRCRRRRCSVATCWSARWPPRRGRARRRDRRRWLVERLGGDACGS